LGRVIESGKYGIVIRSKNVEIVKIFEVTKAILQATSLQSIVPELPRTNWGLE